MILNQYDKNKIKQGDPYCDILRTVADLPENPEISGCLGTIVAFVEAMDPTKYGGTEQECDNCGKFSSSADFQKSLMK